MYFRCMLQQGGIFLVGHEYEQTKHFLQGFM